jgi:hypothetical protein
MYLGLTDQKMDRQTDMLLDPQGQKYDELGRE